MSQPPMDRHEHDDDSTPGPSAPRRAVLQGAAGLLLAWVSPHVAAAQDERTARPAAGDLLVRMGDVEQAPLSTGNLLWEFPTNSCLLASYGTTRPLNSMRICGPTFSMPSITTGGSTP